jgi:hypothetical protein
MENTNHATVDEKIAFYARVWRQAEKEAIANRCDRTKRAEHLARRQLREAVDDAVRRAARTGPTAGGADPGQDVANTAAAGIYS